jgi:hypothetical protein
MTDFDYFITFLHIGAASIAFERHEVSPDNLTHPGNWMKRFAMPVRDRSKPFFYQLAECRVIAWFSDFQERPMSCLIL